MLDPAGTEANVKKRRVRKSKVVIVNKDASGVGSFVVESEQGLPVVGTNSVPPDNGKQLEITDI
jgi:hypothetical protein